MKKILLFSMIFAVTLAFGQSLIKGNGKIMKETRNISGYKGVILKGNIDVVLTPQKQKQITISAEENIVPIIITKIANGNLEISLQNNVSASFKKATVYVPADNIDKIKLVGSGDIETQGMLRSKKLEIHLSGSGDIDLEVKTENILAKLNGSGDIDLKGTTENITAEIKGSGDISAFKLHSKNAEIKLIGSGDVEVNASSYFSGEIIGSGNITVQGKPNNVRTNDKGSGKIKLL